MQPGVPAETALRVYRRYLRLEPLHAEEYIAYLKSKVRPCAWRLRPALRAGAPSHTPTARAPTRAGPQGKWGEAARKLAELVNDDTFRSLEGKSKHQLWLELCDLVTKHPAECAALRVDAILRSGIRKFTDEARASAPRTAPGLARRRPPRAAHTRAAASPATRGARRPIGLDPTAAGAEMASGEVVD